MQDELYGNALKEELMDMIDISRDIEDEEIGELIDKLLLEKMEEEYISIKDMNRLKREIFNSIRRLDILSELLEDDDITEIMINGYQNIYVEKQGRISLIEEQFYDEQKLSEVIQSIVASCNRIVNEASPIVDARLEDGSRVNVVLPPIALDGAIMTIRKFPKDSFTMEKLIEMGAISRECGNMLKLLVRSGYNIFISGGTGSGKTTFLNALTNYIPEDERIITIEDAAELAIENIGNLVRLEARNANVNGENAIAIKDLIKSALRMRPDRIIVGEIRDGAALDMLSAMNTGHDGSISTGHANSSKDMLTRLETMVLMAVDMPLMAIRQQIASAVDIIIHLGRLRDKSRKVLEIVEVLGMKGENIELNPLYIFCEEESVGNGVAGLLVKENDLVYTDKLVSSGLYDMYIRGEVDRKELI